MSKEEKYQTVLPQIQSLVAGENDDIAKMANIALGPFQGPVACTHIPYGKGVCGTAWKQRETVIVPDVHLFPGHIACSSASQSEIVVPLFRNDEVFAVLDIDSAALNTFDAIDRQYLEQIASFYDAF